MNCPAARSRRSAVCRAQPSPETSATQHRTVRLNGPRPDGSRIALPTLRSERLGLVGRPDQLVRVDGHPIPVEHKPRAWRVHDTHVMQIAAECLLISEVYGVRPAYSLPVLANGRQHRVAVTRQFEERPLQMLARMQDLLEPNQDLGSQWLGGWF